MRSAEISHQYTWTTNSQTEVDGCTSVTPVTPAPPAPEAAHVAVVSHRDHKLLMHAIYVHKANIQEIQGCVEFLRILKEM